MHLRGKTFGPPSSDTRTGGAFCPFLSCSVVVTAVPVAHSASDPQVWQNERWLPFVGWGRQTLTDVHGRLPRPFEAMDLLVEQSGYRWWGDWALAQGEKFGEQGWQYATDFGGEYAAQSRRRTTVRRRLWTRGCIPKWAPGFSPDT